MRRWLQFLFLVLAVSSHALAFPKVCPDHLGSSSLLSDRSGNPVERTVFSAYGREWNSASSATIRETHRYTGQPLDDETGLYFYGFRYYDPQLARFIQPDSIIPDRFNPQTWNRFSYVRNNPLKYTDPTGHADQTPNWESSLSSDFHNLADPNAKGAPSGTLTYGAVQMSTVGAETRNGIAIATIEVGQEGTKQVITTVVGAKAVQLTAKGVAKVAEKVAEKAPSYMERISSIYRKFKGAEKAAEKTADAEKLVEKATTRGRASEGRVLEGKGLGTNTSKVSTSEGNSIPDALTDTLSVEVKDAKVVNATKQLRIQTDAAKAAERKSVLVTWDNTKVSAPAQKIFDEIERRPDLGPKN